MLCKVLCMLALATMSLGMEDEDSEAVMRILASLADEDRNYAFDFDDMEEVKKVFEDYGLDANEMLSDFLAGIPGLFTSGDARRFTTLNFAYQLACYQGVTGSVWKKSLWAYRTYNGYACYCGGGIYNGIYLDATDYCCKLHDKCYEDAAIKYKLKDGCHTYTTPYYVACCKEQKITKCTDGGPSAGRALCECDQAMARCVAQRNALSTYNKALYNNRKQCNATGSLMKPMSPLAILKSCKHAFKTRVKFPITYGSQGICPKPKKKGWFRRIWGKKK